MLEVYSIVSDSIKSMYGKYSWIRRVWDAEDIIHEVMVSFLERGTLEKYDSRTKRSTFFSVCARNCFLNIIRKTINILKESEVAIVEEILPGEESALPILEVLSENLLNDTSAYVDALEIHLECNLKNIAYLKVLGFSQEDIAGIFSISKGALYTHMIEIRRVLREECELL